MRRERGRDEQEGITNSTQGRQTTLLHISKNTTEEWDRGCGHQLYVVSQGILPSP